MNWFWQILLQGLIVAGIVTFAASTSWFPIQLFFLVLACYVLYFLTRNPRFFYRRGFQAALVAALLPPSLSLRTRGGAVAPDNAGFLQFFAELEGNVPSGLFLAAAFLCLVGDLVNGYLETRRRAAIYSEGTAAEAELLLVENADLIRSHADFRAPSEVMIRGANLRILSLWVRSFACRVVVTENELKPGIEASDVLPVRVAGGTTVQLLVEAMLLPGIYQRWIRLRAGKRLPMPFPLRAVINLRSMPATEPLPVTIRAVHD